jgi:hypothetical protein
MQALEKTAALHDVPETKGLSVYRQNVSSLYLIQVQRVSLKVGSGGEKMGVALHDVLETKGVSVYRQNVLSVYPVQIQRVSLKVWSQDGKDGRASPRCIRNKRG